MLARLHNPWVRSGILVLLLMLVVAVQYEYDATDVPLPPTDAQTVSPFMVRAVDMGFHPAVASFLWATTMPEILDLWNKKTEYLTDLAFLNAVDPKLSYPYAFSVLTLTAVPTSSYPQALARADAIGEQGIAAADPDWRIPYYMGMNDFLYAKNEQKALLDFNRAAQTPGIPAYAERFSLNFGVGTNERQKTEELWSTIKASTNDPDEKARAQAFMEHLQIFDYLDAAAKEYKKEFGKYPVTPQDLVTKGIIPAVPTDPFGFSFIMKGDGTSGLDLQHLPAYLEQAPQQ